MSKFWQCSFLALAFGAMFAPFGVSLPCRAQLKETALPPGVPAKLWVPNRFERAVKNQSSGLSYLLVTVVNDATGGTKRVCIEGTALFEAVRIENQLGRGWGGSRENQNKALRLILENPTRAYHFKNAEAWKIV